MLFLDTVRRLLRGGDAADPEGFEPPETRCEPRPRVPGYAHPAERAEYVKRRLRELQAKPVAPHGYKPLDHDYKPFPSTFPVDVCIYCALEEAAHEGR